MFWYEGGWIPGCMGGMCWLADGTEYGGYADGIMCVDGIVCGCICGIVCGIVCGIIGVVP